MNNESFEPTTVVLLMFEHKLCHSRHSYLTLLWCYHALAPFPSAFLIFNLTFCLTLQAKLSLWEVNQSFFIQLYMHIPNNKDTFLNHIFAGVPLDLFVFT